MCFGGVAADIDLSRIPLPEGAWGSPERFVKLYSESNTRFLIEVSRENAQSLEKVFSGLPLYRVGRTGESGRLKFRGVMEVDIEKARALWKNAVRWHR